MNNPMIMRARPIKVKGNLNIVWTGKKKWRVMTNNMKELK